VEVVVYPDREGGRAPGWESDRRDHFQFLVVWIERQHQPVTGRRDVHELRNQEGRGSAEVRSLRDHGDQLGEPVSAQRWAFCVVYYVRY
jgi:hypothetical protein